MELECRLKIEVVNGEEKQTKNQENSTTNQTYITQTVRMGCYNTIVRDCWIEITKEGDTKQAKHKRTDRSRKRGKKEM